MNRKLQILIQDLLRLILIFALLLPSVNDAFGQDISCSVRVDKEPDPEYLTFSLPISNICNSSLSSIATMHQDGNFFNGTLSSGESQCINFDHLGINISEGSQISGFSIRVTGYQDIEKPISVEKVQLYKNRENFIGINKAHKTVSGKELNSEIGTWQYGYSADSWNIKLSDSLINDENFGFQFEFKNNSASVANFFLDKVEIRVYFKKLFSICDHDSAVFYVDPQDDMDYQWKFSDDLKLSSESSQSNIINLDFAEAPKGIYSICVNSISNGEILNTCCRDVLVENCEPSRVTGYIWIDSNSDGIRQVGETGKNNTYVNLVDANLLTNVKVETSDLGIYSFADVPEGYYYIEIDEPDFFLSPYQVGNNLLDSDGFRMGEMIRTATFYVGPDLDFSGIDIGLISDEIISESSISGIVYNDIFGILDGKTSAVLSSISIQLVNELGEIESEVISNSTGFYEFKNVANGNYKIRPVFPLGIDYSKDFEVEKLSIAFDGEKSILNLDLYLIEYSELGNTVWEDLNYNGLQDENEVGLPSVVIVLKDENGSILQSTISQSNGFYVFDSIYPGKYYINFASIFGYEYTVHLEESENLNSDVIDSLGNTTTIEVLSGLKNLDIDAGFKRRQNFVIGDFVWFDTNQDGVQAATEQGIDGIIINLFAEHGKLIDSTITSKNPIDGKSGHYSFKGTYKEKYYLEFKFSENYVFSVPNIGNRDLDSDVTGTFGPGTTDLFELGATEKNIDLDAGVYFNFVEIGDYVWSDLNANGKQEIIEPGINGIKVNLFNDSNELIAVTTTGIDPKNGNSGYYHFEGSFVGFHYLEFVISTDMKFSPSKKGLDALDSDVTGENGIGTTSLINFVGGRKYRDIDAGIFMAQTSIGDFVWIDVNLNGFQDADEPGVSGIQIVLYDSNDNYIDRTISDGEGFYLFDNLNPGKYYMIFSKKPSLLFTNSFLSMPDINSDANQEGRTNTFDLYSGEAKRDIDVGYISRTRIGDFVWHDLNKDGIQNGEPGLSGILISLFDKENNFVASTVSNEQGKYAFYGINGGEYYIRIEIPDGFQVSIADAANDQIDNDAFFDGRTENFVLGTNHKIDDLDFALFDNSSPLSGLIHHDKNFDHKKNSFEKGVEGIKINVINEYNNNIHTIITNSQGFFDVGILPKGFYAFEIELPDSFFVSNQINSFVSFENGSKSQMVESTGIEMRDLNVGIYTYGVIDLNLWVDNDGNGIREEGEGQIKDFNAQLFTIEGEYVGDFSGILAKQIKTIPGTYFIKMNQDSEMFITDYKVAGSSDLNDSDFIENGEEYESLLFTIFSEDRKENLSAGFYESASLGKMVWLDEDFNGMQSEGEVGIIGAKISIFDEQNDLIGTEITDENGFYNFSKLRKGNYYLKFELKKPYEFTQVISSDQDHNSDVDNANGYGTTKLFSVLPAQEITNIDAGVVINEILFSNLLEFVGRREGEENILDWTTQSERSASKYILERRKDGAHEFRQIAEITAIDQEKYLQEYRFVDRESKEEGNYYYRLKEYDIEGNYSYSHIIVVQALGHSFTIDIFPNPAIEILNVQFEVAEKSKISIKLLDEAGRRISNFINYQEFKTGIYERSFDIKSLPKGFYILQIDAGYRTYHHKIIINKD